MRARSTTEPQAYVDAIRASGLTIYDHIEVGDPTLWIPTPQLEILLNLELCGLSLAGLPLRTRSKRLKEHICGALGYPIPTTFKKTQPRFPGQSFDTYAQKSDNFQVWNEQLAPTRRYVFVRVSSTGVISRVKVVTGDRLALLDTTGTLTQKFQASCIPGSTSTELVTPKDTTALEPFVAPGVILTRIKTPVAQPQSGELLPINVIYERLSPLIGQSFLDAGVDQERNRGAALHRLVCTALGFTSFQDDGQFPDVRHQLLEVKLQTSPTIDLGLVTPASIEPLDVPMIQNRQIRHCDVRYAVFYGAIANGHVQLSHFFLTTGEKFFTRFPQFQGKVLNAKLQIPLPRNFFD
jgi:hypothetical protein